MDKIELNACMREFEESISRIYALLNRIELGLDNTEASVDEYLALLQQEKQDAREE